MIIPRDALLALTNEVLTRAGASSNEAGVIAANLVWCDAAGRGTQGVWRLDTLCERIISGGIKSPCNIGFSHVTDSCVVVDGNDGSGHYVCEQAARSGMLVADHQGIAALGVRNSNYCGALAYYVWMMAEQGYVSFVWSNSYAKVKSYGGTKPILGTNPMAFGAPNETGEHLLIDFSTAASAGSTLRYTDELSDDNAAEDAESSRTVRGAEEPLIEPHGGAKGFALSLICEMLCGLISSAEFSFDVKSLYGDPAQPGKNGQFMLILDPRAFLSAARYGARFEHLFDALLIENGQTRMPGAARHEALKASAQRGIELSQNSARNLKRACQRVGLTFPADGLRAYEVLEGD